MSSRDRGKIGEKQALTFLYDRGFQPTNPKGQHILYDFPPSPYHSFDKYAPPFDLLLKRNGRSYGFQVKYSTNKSKKATFTVGWRNIERLIEQGNKHNFTPVLLFIHGKRICYFILEFENLSLRLKDLEGIISLENFG